MVYQGRPSPTPDEVELPLKARSFTGAAFDVVALASSAGGIAALSEILGGTRMIAEGVGTTAALLVLAREAKVEMPITEQVDAILHQGKPPREAIRDIMDRPQRPE